MNPSRSAILALACAAGFSALLLGACASAPAERYFVLDVAPSNRPALDPAYAGDLSVRVGAIPQSADRPQIVMQRGANELDVREADRWAEPLRGGLERCLVGDLRRALPAAWISSTGPHRDPDPLRLVVEFTGLDAAPDGTVSLRAEWTLATGDGAARRTYRRNLSHKVPGGTIAAIVGAWSDELDELAQEVARSVIARPAAPPLAN